MFCFLWFASVPVASPLPTTARHGQAREPRNTRLAVLARSQQLPVEDARATCWITIRVGLLVIISTSDPELMDKLYRARRE
jgi:hypothetical protein